MFTTRRIRTQTPQHIIRLTITHLRDIQIGTVTQQEAIPSSTKMFKSMSTLRTSRGTITPTQPPIIFIERLRIITLIRTIITMVIFITLITMGRTAERITGIRTGGMLTSS